MKLNIIGASVVSALLFSAAASAADPVIVNGGTVHFTGELVNAACAVSGIRSVPYSYLNRKCYVYSGSVQNQTG